MGYFASPLGVVDYLEQGEEQGVLVSMLMQLWVEFLDGLVPVQDMAYCYLPKVVYFSLPLFSRFLLWKIQESLLYGGVILSMHGVFFLFLTEHGAKMIEFIIIQRRLAH